MRKFYFVTLCLILSALPGEAARHRKHPTRARRPSAASPTLSYERILTIEDHRFSHDKLLLTALRSGSPKLARAALLAAGRIGDISALEEIARFLERKDKELKKTAIFSLSLMGDDLAYKILMQNLSFQRDPDVLSALLVGLGRAGNEQTLNVFATVLKDEASAPALQEGAAHGLGILWAGASEKWSAPAGLLARLAKLAQGSDPGATAAAFALARFKGEPSLLPLPELMEAAGKTSTAASARAFLCRALGRVKSPLVTQFLADLFQSTLPLEARVEVARALGSQLPTEAVMASLRHGMSDPSSAVVTQVLESAGNYGIAATSLADPVQSLFNTSSSTWVRGSALKALAHLNPTAARLQISALLSQPAAPLFSAAVGALANLATQDDLTKLAELSNYPSLEAAEEAAEAFGSFTEDRITPPMKAELRKALERGDTALSSLIAQLVEKLKWKDFAPSLATVYRLFSSADQLEGKVAVLNALAVVGDHSEVELLELAMNDPDRLVVVAAANALKAVTGKDQSARIPLNSRINAPSVNGAEVSSALHSQVVLKTSRGEIQLKMVEEAPLTAVNFVRLVRKGFYDGRTFHRVVPDFVTQGGDPRGDGYGGPGYFIRDEVSPLRHERGTVGIATSGKDTGGCQFFFNLAPNLHLDGRYTLFARVVKGVEVIDQLEVGDKILSARLR